MSKDAITKAARRLQKAFAQLITEPQPSYTWCRNRVVSLVAAGVPIDRETFHAESITAWRVQR